MENLRNAFQNAQKDKRHYREVIEINKNPDKWLLELQQMLINKEFKNGKYKVFVKKDSGKERTIYKLPFYPDRIIHWAIMQQTEHIFMNKLNHCTHSAIPKRGVHSAFKQLDNYMQKDVDNEYCLKFDIRKFYPSIKHDLLKQMYRKMFKDKDLLWLLDEIIDSIEGDVGVPIGNYLSQYSANLFLYKFDRWLKEELKVRYLIRYMDDVVILHDDKKYLHDLLKKIRVYLREELDLELKSNYQIFISKQRGVDFVGYRHFGKYVLLRKSISKALIRKMRNINKNLTTHNQLTYSEYCSINSYKGWLLWCDGHNLYKKWIEPLEPYMEKYYKEVIIGESS